MYKILITSFIIMLIGSIGWAIVGKYEAINFVLASISSAFVIYASYLGYVKLIQNKSKDYVIDEEDDKSDEDEKLPTKSVVAQTFKGWIFPLRLIAYIVLVLSFLALSGKNILILAPYLLGLAVVPIAVMLQFYFVRKSDEKVIN